MDDKEIMRHEDFTLRVSHLDVLEGPCYINDQIIRFYCLAYPSSTSQSDDILLFPPSVPFWLANSNRGTLKEVVDPLKLSNKKLVLFTVNDNDDLDGAENGTHWSLLVCDRSKNAFFHHEKVNGTNDLHAKELYEAAKGCVGQAVVPLSSSSSSSSSSICRTGKIELPNYL